MVTPCRLPVLFVAAVPPKRLQLFIWLLMQRRIQCQRVNLLRKQIIDSAVCEVCEQEDESADHVIVGCPFAKEFWAKLGIDLPMDTSNVPSDLHNIQRPATIPRKHWSTFIALCCWQLWKRRNREGGFQVGANKQASVRCRQRASLMRTFGSCGSRRRKEQLLKFGLVFSEQLCM